jgi:uncharacterized phage protein (TIGR02218 family)
MKTGVSQALLDHLASGVTTLAACWKLTLRDGTVMGFTDHDTDIPFNGVTYEAASGFDASRIATAGDLSVDELEVDALLESSGITDGDLEAGRFDFAEIEIFSVNYQDLSQGRILWRKGWLGEVTTEHGIATAEVRGLTQALKQTVGETYSVTCRAELGDARCGVDLSGHTVTGTVTAVTDAQQFTDSGRAEADDHFTYGLLTWTGGANAGLEMEVKAFSAGTFTLYEPMPYPVAAGDGYEVYAGCDKLHTTCINKFGNIDNFRGEPFIPGTDEISRFGGQG